MKLFPWEMPWQIVIHNPESIPSQTVTWKQCHVVSPSIPLPSRIQFVNTETARECFSQQRRRDTLVQIRVIKE